MNLEKSITETNARLKNNCSQKGLGYIKNNGIKEVYLGKKCLHLNKKCNSALAKNLLRCIERKEWSVLSIDVNSGNDCLSVTPENANWDVFSNLNNIWKNNSKKIIIAHLNINLIRNKFDFLADIVKDDIDILMISESKLGDLFPDTQFLIEGFGKPFCLDRDRNGGGIMLFNRSDIPKSFLEIKTLLKVFMLN